jgi:hypothetical protein
MVSDLTVLLFILFMRICFIALWMWALSKHDKKDVGLPTILTYLASDSCVFIFIITLFHTFSEVGATVKTFTLSFVMASNLIAFFPVLHPVEQAFRDWLWKPIQEG